MRGAIHNLTINHRAQGPPDDEGRLGTVVVSSTKVMGRMVIWTGKETALSGRYAEDLNAIAALPSGTAIESQDQIVAAGIDPTIDGTYEVMYVVYMPSNLEAYLRLRGA